MFRFTLLVLFLISFSAQAQYNSSPAERNTNSDFKMFDSLFSAVKSGIEINAEPDLADFKIKIQEGLDFMSPGSLIKNLKCEKLTDWSDSCSKKLNSFLEEKYSNDMSQRDPGWIDLVISNFRNKQSLFGIMYWEIISDGKLKHLRSIAVFDNNWTVLFDTELINFVVNVGAAEISKEDRIQSTETDAIINQRNGTANANYNVNGTFGSVRLRNEVHATAIAPPYVTAATNDAMFNFFTTEITSERINETGIPPSADPFLYFGIDGTYAALYQNAIPYYSAIYLSNVNDNFNSGIYQVTGDNGLNWSFEFDFSVDVVGGGIGITPYSNISSLSLSGPDPRIIHLDNYTYMHNIATYDIRALFYNGGSLNLDDFKIITGPGGSESGSVDVKLPLRVGHHYDGAFSTQTFWHSNESIILNLLDLQYVRGDAVLQPEYQMTTTNYNISIGEIDTLEVNITNRSHVAGLNGGNVSINTASLDNKLTLLSPATLPIGTIGTSGLKTFKFVVRGNANGIVTPQANISAMKWEWPVPPDVVINNVVSIDNNIEVGQVTGTLSLTNIIQGRYNENSNTMIRDTIRVYLRNSGAPYEIVDSSKAYLTAAGEALCNFYNINSGVPYYIQLNNRNSIETWGAIPQSFSNSVMTYDFSTSSAQAFGNNMINVDSSPIRFAIYSGDVNQDGSVDVTDIINVYNNAVNFSSGYLPSDINGDLFTDTADLIMTYNNSNNFVSVMKP